METHFPLDHLLCGDSLCVLRTFPDDVVDLGVTSPPYNKQETPKGWRVNTVIYDGITDAIPEPEYQANQIAVLNEVYRVIKPGGSLFYNHKIRWDRGTMYHPMDWLRQTDWTVKQEIIWNRVLAANLRGWRYWQVDERVYWLYKPIGNALIGKELQSKYAKLSSVWQGMPESKNPHPAPFPLWLPTRVIASILESDVPGTVLDPYVGSGTTAVAAKLLGHHYVGIDVSAEYLAVAEQRLNNAMIEMAQVQKEMDLHIVSTTFKEHKERGLNLGKFSSRKTVEPRLFGCKTLDI